jgi:hypothetical protein
MCIWRELASCDLVHAWLWTLWSHVEPDGCLDNLH